MFCDETTVKIQAGNGGDGSISFHREKFIAKGGPDGGNGGKGGDVFFCADENINTLIDLHTKKKIKSNDGIKGSSQKKNGANGEDVFIKVPIGTKVVNSTDGKDLADLKGHGDKVLIAHGGRGGFGNAHFTTSIRQTPRFAELGEKGQEIDVKLEMNLVADVGIIGLPNAGKSTFISSVSSAKPKIGNFPFTTIIPNLGIVKIENNKSMVLCDMPGLIRGASKGKGMGFQFLKHVNRNKILLHLVDVNSNSIVDDFDSIANEIKNYDKDLINKKVVVAFTKLDTIDFDNELIQEIKTEFLKNIKLKEEGLFFISSATKKGVRDLVFYLYKNIENLKNIKHEKEVYDGVIFQPHLEKDPKSFIIKKEGDKYRVLGKRVEQIVNQTDFCNKEAVDRVYDVIKKMKINNELIKNGAIHGDKILISNREIEFKIDLTRGVKNKKHLLKEDFIETDD